MTENEHVGLDELAEHAEGLLPDDAEAGVVAHLSGCADCAARLRSLAEVSGILAAEPLPALPEDVAARLDAAIAHESAARAANAGTGSEASGVDVMRPDAGDDPSERRSEPQQGLAPVVPLGARSGPHGTGSSRGTGDSRGAGSRRQGRWLRPLAAAAAAVVVAGGAATLVRQQLNTDSAGSSDAGSGAPKRNEQTRQGTGTAFLRSGTHYTSANLAGKVSALAAGAVSHSQKPNALRPADAPRGCLATVAKRAGVVEAPLFVDSAGYAGSPATVIAYRLSPHRLGVWVVKGACRADAPIVTHVRVHTPR